MTSDGQLLECFLQEQDERAFEELVRRHGALVLGVCRRVLGDSSDVDEAFQNTFLVLLRKAGGLLKSDSLRGWLYQVAIRRALNVREAKLIRRRRTADEEELKNVIAPDRGALWGDVRAIVDEELSQLAEKYRLPLILCFLEGKSSDEAASLLRLNGSTLRSRLMRGRELLRTRLSRRGVSVYGSVLGTLLLENRSEAASEALIQTTVQTANRATPTAAGVTAGSSVLAGLLKGMFTAMPFPKFIILLVTLPGLFLVSWPVLHWFEGRSDLLPEGKHLSEQASFPKAPSQRTAEISGAGTAAQSAAIPAMNIRLPTSIEDYVQRFKSAASLSDAGQRWYGLRELGITLSDEEFIEAETLAQTVFERSKQQGAPSKITSGLSRERLDFFHAAVFAVWVEADPTPAANWVYRLQAFRSERCLGLFFVGFKDFNEIKKSSTKTNLGAQSYFLYQVISQWAGRDMDAVFVWLRAKGMQRGSLYEAMELRRASELKKREKPSDPIAARDWALALPEGKSKMSHFRTAISAWVERDSEAAKTWTAQLPDGSGWIKEEAGVQIARTLAKESPQVAFEWVQQAFKNGGNAKAVAIIASSWADRDPQVAMEWAEKLQDKKLRDEASKAIVDKQVNKLTLDRETSFVELMAVVESLPNVYRDDSVKKVVTGWMTHHQSVEPIIGWLDSKPAGMQRDELVSYVLGFYSHTLSPEHAWELAETIKDSRVRLVTWEGIARNWLDREPKAAAKWILRSSLPQETKNRLLKQEIE